MPIDIILGLQWGDEGKGRVAHYLAPRYQLVCRAGGGPNAQHTVWHDGKKFQWRHLPASCCFPNIATLLGSGVALDVKLLLDELAILENAGFATTALRICRRAHVIMPYHHIIEAWQESLRGSAKIGTTGRGMGPVMADKVNRTGIRLEDLFDARQLREKLHYHAQEKRPILDAIGAPPLDVEALLKTYCQLGERVASYVTDGSQMVQEALAAGHEILIEGSQGAELDLDHGTYPFVTTGATSPAALVAQLGVPTTAIRTVFGVMSAIPVRVGYGPFPSEIPVSDERDFRERTGIHGKRVGWLDLATLHTAVQRTGCTRLIVTQLDRLFQLDAITIHAGQSRESVVAAAFADDADSMRRHVLAMIETHLRIPIDMVCVGPQDADTILSPR